MEGFMESSQLLLLMAGWNLLVFLLYGVDKWKAKQKLWRIPEKVLLTVGLAGGGIGAACGMLVFRHKTNHWSFRIGVPFGLILSLAEWFMMLQGNL